MVCASGQIVVEHYFIYCIVISCHDTENEYNHELRVLLMILNHKLDGLCDRFSDD